MNRVVGFLFKILIGVIVIEFIISALSPGGVLSGWTGMLITKYPFHEYLMQTFAESLGFDISFVPEVATSLLDDACVLLIAMLISSGIASTLMHIFNPAEGEETGQNVGYALRGVVVSLLSSIVTILFSNLIFGSILQWVNASKIPMVLFRILEVVVMIIVVVLFLVFAKSVVDVASGRGFGFGLFLFFVLRSVIRTVLVDVVSVWALLGIVNHAKDAAIPLIGIYVVLILGTTAVRGIRG